MSLNGIFNSHYKKDGIDEPWDFMKSEDPTKFKEYLIGNVFKYLFRAGIKEGESELKDLNKTKAYLDELIDLGETNVYFKNPTKTYNWLVKANPLNQNLIVPTMNAKYIRTQIEWTILNMTKGVIKK